VVGRVAAASLFLCLVGAANADVRVNGTLTSSVLVYEDHDDTNADDVTVDVFQNLRLTARKVGAPWLAFQVNYRVASVSPESRLNGLWFTAHERGWPVKARVGRQFVHLGAASGLVDGGYADATLGPEQLTGFAGIPVEYADNLDIRPFSHENLWAVRLGTKRIPRTNVGVSFAQRTEETHVSWRVLGFDALVVPWRRLSADLRAGYDIENEELDNVRGYVSYRPTSKVRSGLDYRFRRPRVRNSSIFSVFESDPYHDVTLRGSYRVSLLASVFGSLGYTSFEHESAERFRVGLGLGELSLGVYTESGRGGPCTGGFGSFGVNISRSARVDASFDMSQYHLDDDNRDDNLTRAVGTLRGSFDLAETLSAVLEGELSRDEVFNYEARLFASVAWRFRTPGVAR
jgi:hypothetical protein